MFKNYLLVTIRNLKKNSTYSWLNIVGLSIGLTAFLLIALYVRYELSFDRHFKNAGRIYRIIREGRAFTPAGLGPELRGKIPEVESAGRMVRRSGTPVSNKQRHFLEEDFYWAEPEMFAIFSIPFLSGDPKTALDDPASIVLSRSTAKKYFGSADPMGKTLTVNEQSELTVSGVFADLPANSHLAINAVAPYETFFRITGDDINGWTSNFSYTYVLIREGSDPQAAADKISPLIEVPLLKAAGMKEPYPKYFFIQPITDIHLRSRLMQEIGPNNDIKSVFLFSTVAFLILIIACINYMNLATARSLQRGKEVGMRKVVGAKKRQIAVQFLGESAATGAVAMIVSAALVVSVLPVFNNLVERQLRFDPIRNSQLLLGLVLVTVFVGLFAGSYPALRMSGFKPISVLSGTFTRSRKGSWLRNALVLLQFTVTIALIVCTLAVRAQLQFIKNRNMGYTREQIITLPVRGSASVGRNIQSIKAELLRHPAVSAVSTSGRLPNNIDTFTSRDWTGRNPDEPIPIFYNVADYDFVDLFGMEIVEGRNFSRDFPSDRAGVFLVNETAVKVAEWESAIGRTLTHYTGQTGKIVGVIKDFHLRSLHNPIAPLYVFLDSSTFSYLSIKMKTDDIPATLGYVEGIMKKFSPDSVFAYSFFDEVFERAYFSEQRMGKIFGAFAFLAIFIACLGLFGLTAFAAEQRTKEIGIRKVLGASDPKIFLLLSREFVRWVLLANIAAWPAAYLIMKRWLQNFAYRTDLGVAAFLISGAAALLIAALTVSYQSIKSARANPADSLRYE